MAGVSSEATAKGSSKGNRERIAVADVTRLAEGPTWPHHTDSMFRVGETPAAGGPIQIVIGVCAGRVAVAGLGGTREIPAHAVTARHRGWSAQAHGELRQEEWMERVVVNPTHVANNNWFCYGDQCSLFALNQFSDTILLFGTINRKSTERKSPRQEGQRPPTADAMSTMVVVHMLNSASAMQRDGCQEALLVVSQAHLEELACRRAVSSPMPVGTAPDTTVVGASAPSPAAATATPSRVPIPHPTIPMTACVTRPAGPVDDEDPCPAGRDTSTGTAARCRRRGDPRRSAASVSTHRRSSGPAGGGV